MNEQDRVSNGDEQDALIRERYPEVMEGKAFHETRVVPFFIGMGVILADQLKVINLDKTLSGIAFGLVLSYFWSDLHVCMNPDIQIRLGVFYRRVSRPLMVVAWIVIVTLFALSFFK